LAYVADYYSLQIIDIQNPAHLTLRGSYATPGAALDVQVMGTVAYLAVANSGLHILDVADPAHPRLLSVYTGDNFSANKLQIMDNRVYAVGTSYYDTCADIEIIDVSDPTKPLRRGNSVVIGRSSYDDIYVASNVAYLIGIYYPGSTSVAIFDVSNPALPTYR